MSKSTVVALRGKEEVVDPLSELLRAKGQELLAAAVQAEAAAFLEQYAERRDGQGRRAVVRNGYQPRREILTGIGPLAVAVPKSRDRSGQGRLFRSRLVPPYVRKSRSIEALLPWLYLKGVSSGDMQEALAGLLGAQARGLSPAVIGRLKAQWSVEHAAWQKRDLSGQRWVYVWADGIYSGLRAEDERLCLLVVIGVNERGQKHFLAIEDGLRESTESWKMLLRDLKERGLNAPKLAIGDGALGFWAALREVFAKTREQRCWVHKAANVLNYLPKSLQAKPMRGCARFGWPPPKCKPSGPSRNSCSPIRPSIRRRRRVCRKIAPHCSPSTTFRPSTGSISAPPTRSSRASAPFAIALIKPTVRCRGRVCWGWSTNSRCVRSNRFADSMASRCSPKSSSE